MGAISFTTEQVQEIVASAKELAMDLSENPKEYSTWETQFILSIESQIEQNRPLSPKQLVKINEVAEKHLGTVDFPDEDELEGDLRSAYEE